MPVKIFHGRERDQEFPVLEDEINNFEIQLYNKGMQISNITSSVTYEGKLVVIVHYGNTVVSDTDKDNKKV
jgi:hypothetical protein